MWGDITPCNNGQCTVWVGSGFAVEKELGVMVNKSNRSQQCTVAWRKAGHLLHYISQGRCRDLILPRCSAQLKKHLEYCAQFWAPQ